MGRLAEAVVVAVALTAWAGAGRAQSKSSGSTAPCSATPQPESCNTGQGQTNSSQGQPDSAPAKKPDAMDKFPFPGESGASPAPGAAQPSLSGVPDAPETPDAGPPGASSPDAGAKPDAAKKFPFPGESGASPSPDAGSSSSSSSSGGDMPAYDPNTGTNPGPGLEDKGSEGSSPTPGRHILHRVNPPGEKLESADERESEDLSVAHFYIDSGDLKGAYLRSQDAVKTAPDDPDAHFTLAEVAAKMNKRDEAIAEYNACLKLDPVEKEAKEARKALERMKGQ